MRRFTLTVLLGAGLAIGLAASASAASITAYFADFDNPDSVASGISAGWSGGTIQSVQGYAGLGTGSSQFGGNFRASYSSTNPGILTLSNLPTHTSIDLTGLLAIIDSWDSDNGSCCTPDYFQILVDGSTVFQDTYNNTLGTNNNTQGLADVAGGAQNRGFNGAWLDQAFDLGTGLTNIAHSGSTLQITFQGTGGGWQGGIDEAWGIENLTVTLNGVEASSEIPEPTTLTLMGAGLIGFGMWRRRRSH